MEQKQTVRNLSIAGALLGSLLGGAGCSLLTARDPVFLTHEAWESQVRDRGVDPTRVPDPLETTEEMRAFAYEVAGGGSMFDRLSRLQSALMDRSLFTIDQNTPETSTAVEAFQLRRGNCVSFTNLFVALARSLGFQLQAGLVIRRDSSERRDDLILVYTHMVSVVRFVKGFAIYDFFGASETRGAEIRLLDDLALTGVLLSNRGVAALRNKEDALALERFEGAVRLAPQFTGGWGNLGLALWRKGSVPEALVAFRKALEIDPQQPVVLHNLAAHYLTEGNAAAARAALMAADQKTVSPHSLIVRGDLELWAGNVKGALRLYRQARSLAPKSPDPLLAIARAEQTRGDLQAAREAAEKASRLAPGDIGIQEYLRGFPKGPDGS